jgi:6-pyruvoyltetrahydropterin/6-carboxytetrahydropterin synthase
VKYTIGKRFEVNGVDHQLTSLPSEHPCSRRHGHNYVVEIELSTDQLDEQGMVLDYHLLEPFHDYLKTWDHQFVNELLPGTEPTAENLAHHLFDKAQDLWPTLAPTVTVRETANTWASVKLVSFAMTGSTKIVQRSPTA